VGARRIELLTSSTSRGSGQFATLLAAQCCTVLLQLKRGVA